MATVRLSGSSTGDHEVVIIIPDNSDPLFIIERVLDTIADPVKKRLVNDELIVDKT